MQTLTEIECAAWLRGNYELARVAAELEDIPRPEDIDKTYESPMEQSEFRRQLLEDIQTLCKQAAYSRFKETKELAAAILKALDDSYVEL